MVRVGIVLEHKISYVGLEVNPTKIYVLTKLPLPSDVKSLRRFLEHARFCRRFIRGFSQIGKPLSNLLYVLMKNVTMRLRP